MARRKLYELLNLPSITDARRVAKDAHLDYDADPAVVGLAGYVAAQDGLVWRDLPSTRAGLYLRAASDFRAALAMNDGDLEFAVAALRWHQVAVSSDVNAHLYAKFSTPELTAYLWGLNYGD